VLIGANMPSILAEISFVSNPGDEHRLETAEYRQRIAESLYRGIANYVNGLSGVKVASKMDKRVGSSPRSSERSKALNTGYTGLHGVNLIPRHFTPGNFFPSCMV